MPRDRRTDDEHENHERWLVSYADFITLLFAFFVVMYAISQVNEGKYRVLSDTLSSAFRNVPGASSGAQVAVNPRAPVPLLIPLKKPRPVVKVDSDQLVKKAKLRNMAKDINEALAPLVKEGQVRITEGALGITVDINASLLFASGDARLDVRAEQALKAVAQVLAPTDFPIIVEGHTDNTPINTPQFPSNWELSGTRASSVVRMFIDNGVDPRRLTATGYAEQRPVEDNATPEGRARNRRVAITIESRTPDNPVEVRLP
ncbi:MAG: flagellar motor protein MotD [Gammaproteobacteria bacterium]|nr:flagellar motor protein MotD [Gammaproteobacteria bacterium]MBU1415424.1 flagellar motor protein MotD [Gammaproteobacteria bacterium]